MTGNIFRDSWAYIVHAWQLFAQYWWIWILLTALIVWVIYALYVWFMLRRGWG